ARALRQTGAPREALAPVRAMLRLGTPDPTLHEEAARVYGALDMDDEAERQVILAGRLAPATSFRR
ncbi:MAG: hypothetical protein KC466_12255, partial [Myxococcales bacterium]|nr:hypothetical protein [Myxococcales bacterium]